ncbi:MAG: Conserved putative secreted protein [Thermoleophilia bacterium]|nr:Conserved putative secreted protein [Thermoleophilia bacterium]
MLSWRPRIRTAVPLLVLVAASALLPAAAAAHDGRGLGDGDTPRAPIAAAAFEAAQDEAFAALPRETAGGRCLRTEDVDGVGDACATRDGLFRVVLDSGATITTHGGDAPGVGGSRAAEAPHMPGSTDALANASVADIQCATATERHIELVYAYPSNKPNRIAAVTGPMRQAIYQASAFIDAESRAIDASSGRRLRVLCSGGLPVVQAVQLPAAGTGGTDYQDVVDGLLGAGFPSPTYNSTSPRRVVTFYDNPASSGAAGTGDLWIDDDAGAGNLNNKGGRYAVEFDWGSSHLPHWDVLLHEASHNMGAVADAAPDASGNGHCNDGLDIMCYADGGGTSNYTTSECTYERYDCGADTYFNPTPAPGSWLATHWNVASTDNAWLYPWDAVWNDGGVPDVTPPTVPGGLALSASTWTSMTLDWSVSTDDRSSVRYRTTVDHATADGGWAVDATLGPFSAPHVVVSGLVSGAPYRVRVVAIDQAGNASGEATLLTSTLAGAPQPPASVSVALATSSSIDVSWPAGTSSGTIHGYDVALQRNDGAWRTLGEATGTSVRLTQLERDSRFRVRIRTRLVDATLSDWRTSDEVATPGTVLDGVAGSTAPPDRPVVRVTVTGATTATAAWTASPGAISWAADLIDGTGAVVRTFPRGSATSLAATGLRPGTEYTVRVTAWAAGIAAGSQPGASTFTTAKDTLAPGVVRLVGAPKVAGARVKVSWRAAADNVAVVRYELQRKVGTRWVSAARVGSAARSATIAGLRAHATTQLRIRAVDSAGLGGRWTSFAVRRR